jgi:hypothetical protein
MKRQPVAGRDLSARAVSVVGIAGEAVSGEAGAGVAAGDAGQRSWMSSAIMVRAWLRLRSAVFVKARCRGLRALAVISSP